MHRQRYITQRDLDGTWSVRELDSNCPASFMGRLIVGMTEKEAILHVRKFNASGVFQNRLNAEPSPVYPAASLNGTD